MRIRVLTVGKPRDRAVRDLCDRYVKRCLPTFRVEWDSVPQGDPQGSRRPSRAVAAEGDRLLRRIDRSDVNVALDERGRPRSSRDLAGWLGDLRDQGRSVCLIVGGAHGLAGEVLDACPVRLSLSSMTLPHELALLLLVEQVYRAKTILAGEPYHHGRGS